MRTGAKSSESAAGKCTRLAIRFACGLIAPTRWNGSCSLRSLAKRSGRGERRSDNCPEELIENAHELSDHLMLAFLLIEVPGGIGGIQTLQPNAGLHKAL